MEIFKKCNNLAGKFFQSKSKSNYVNCFDTDSGQKPFIIRLQFRQVKWFLRKVRFVVFSQIIVGRVSRPRARATFAPGGKSSQKRRLDLRSKNPLARGETFLAGNFPARPRRFFRFFPRSEDCASTASRVALSRAAGWCHGRGFAFYRFWRLSNRAKAARRAALGGVPPGAGVHLRMLR